MSRVSTPRRAHGFSLIELMVAITLGLILTAAVGTIFVQSKKSYALQEKLSRMQENGRFAMHFLIKDIRLAGYSGCLDELVDGQSFQNNLKNKNDFPFTATIALEGLEQSSNKWFPSGSTGLPNSWLTGTDAISLRMVDPSTAVSISDPMPNTSAELKVSGTSGLSDGDIVMISDCANADVFQITAVQTSSSHIQHAASQNAGNGNADKNLSKQYDTNAKLMKYIGRRYYVRNDDSGVPTLYRDTNGGTPEPLVSGIEQLQIRYGKDTSGDRYPDTYLAPGSAGLQTSNDWANVVSVRIGLIARSTETDNDINQESYEVNGETIAAKNDYYRRRVYTATILVRNLAR